MKSELFQDAICDIDDDLIRAADAAMPKKSLPVFKTVCVVAAACVALVCAAVIAVPMFRHAGPITPPIEGTTADDVSTEKNVYIFSISDSLDQKILDDFEFCKKENYANVKIEEAVNVFVDDKEYLGRYLKTRYEVGVFYPVYSYITDDGDVFDIDDNGNLVYFFWASDKGENANEVGKEECQSKVETFLKQYVNIDNYSVDISENNEGYCFTYFKSVGDIKLLDTACVNVSKSGQMITFSSRMLGKIDEDIVQNINKDECLNAIKEKLTEKIRDISFEKIDVVDYYLTVSEDNERIFVATMDLESSEIMGEHITITGSRIQAAVRLS